MDLSEAKASYMSYQGPQELLQDCPLLLVHPLAMFSPCLL